MRNYDESHQIVHGFYLDLILPDSTDDRAIASLWDMRGDEPRCLFRSGLTEDAHDAIDQVRERLDGLLSALTSFNESRRKK